MNCTTKCRQLRIFFVNNHTFTLEPAFVSETGAVFFNFHKIHSTMSIKNIRLEVMSFLEKNVETFIDQYLIPIEKIWQPSDYLPDSEKEMFLDDITELRELAKELPYDFWVVLVGDTITEEALPTYESWLMEVDGIYNGERSGWAKWIRHWTGEENRHGDLLNKYLYLSGRINMKEVEKTTQYLISDGFDIGTGRDPYKNFVYTSFQELATFVSHNRVGDIAKSRGDERLARMCKRIAGDEMRHHNAYSEFVKQIFEVDASQMMLAFEYMMKCKIVMPAHFLRESGDKIGTAFEQFSNAAQRMGVYTASDYVDIMKKLISKWQIDKITGLTDEAERARDYLMNLPMRMAKIAERFTVPVDSYQFKWVLPAVK